MTGITDLNQLAQKLNTQIEKANNVTFASFAIPGLGREPKLLGAIAAMNTNDVSIPLIGDIGVYVVKIDNITPAPEQFDAFTLKNQIEQANRAQVNYVVFEALKDKVGVEDNRHKFY
jgi:peptidyl-prolyl cis-trans isomerase D